MRVAVVTHYFPTSVDPWAGHSAYQTLRLLARACDVHVFYPAPAYPSFLTPPRHRGGRMASDWQPGDVDVTYIPYPILPVISRPLNGFVIANRLLPHVRQWSPDIILNYVIYPHGYAAVRLGKALGVPVVLTAIGSDLNRIADPLCRILTCSALRHAEYVTTVSQDLCNTARRLGASPSRSEPILNGCDTGIFHPSRQADARKALALDPDSEIILYVGRLDFRKGLVELVDAVARLASQRPHLHCYIMGDGPDKSMLIDAVTRHNVSGKITFVPSRGTKEVAVWMAAADLVTLPSYNEGCPNVVLEALSVGRPVVATRVGGIPELMDDTCGRLVPPQDVPSLAGALDQTLHQHWDPNTISAKHGRSWEEVASELHRILELTRQNRR